MNKFDIRYGGNTAVDLLEKLSSSGILLNNYAEMIFRSELFKVSIQVHKISLTETCLGDLGFYEGATMIQIQKNLTRFDLSECPPEIAPYLRLQLQDQREVTKETSNEEPPGSLTVFSNPFSDDDNFPKGFYLRKIDGKSWLRGYVCSMDHVWKPDSKMIFKNTGL